MRVILLYDGIWEGSTVTFQMFLLAPKVLLSWRSAKVKKACIKVKGIEWCVFHKIMV